MGLGAPVRAGERNGRCKTGQTVRLPRFWCSTARATGDLRTHSIFATACMRQILPTSLPSIRIAIACRARRNLSTFQNFDRKFSIILRRALSLVSKYLIKSLIHIEPVFIYFEILQQSRQVVADDRRVKAFFPDVTINN